MKIKDFEFEIIKDLTGTVEEMAVAQDIKITHVPCVILIGLFELNFYIHYDSNIWEVSRETINKFVSHFGLVEA